MRVRPREQLAREQEATREELQGRTVYISDFVDVSDTDLKKLLAHRFMTDASCNVLFDSPLKNMEDGGVPLKIELEEGSTRTYKVTSNRREALKIASDILTRNGASV